MATSRKPAATTEHFALTWRRQAVAVEPVKLLRAPVLALAISKKFLPRAVDRNRVKRIAREAWRARASAQPSLARELSVFIRLLRHPAVLDAVTDTQKKRLLRAELDLLLTRLPRVRT